jgi:hypothetical protein
MQTVTIEETYKFRGAEKTMTSMATTARLGNGTESHIAVIEYGEADRACVEDLTERSLALSDTNT